MSAHVKKGDDGVQIHKIRISMSSRNGRALEKTCTDLMSRAKEENIKARGPVRLPTRTLRITTRKSPCGNGTNSWDRYEMKIHKRLIDLYAQQEMVKKITSINIDPSVDVEVSVTDQ